MIDDIAAGGIMPLQHHDRKYDLSMRVVKYAGRYEGKDPVGKDAPLKGTLGDLLGGILWPFEPGVSANAIATGTGLASSATTTKTRREIPAWGFGFPAITVEGSRAEGKVFKVKVRPIGDNALTADRRFKILDVLTPSSVASGARGTLMAVTEEYEQILVFLPSQSSLVAVHYGGPGSAGSLVHDVDSKGEIDPDAAATLQHLGRVHFAPKACAPYSDVADVGKGGLAIQVGKAAGGIMGGILAAGGELAALMHPLGGPLHLGIAGEDKHFHGTNKKGETYNPVHLSTKATWIKAKGKPGGGGSGTQEKERDKTQERAGGPASTSRADEVQDGPLKFTDEEVKNVNPLPGVDVETRLVYDPVAPHPTPCGPRPGLFKWVTKVPIYVPPPPPITDGPNTPDRPGGGDPGNPWRPGDPGRPPPPITDGPAWGYDNDPCRRWAVSTLNEFAFPAISYQAQDPRTQSKEFFYARDWTEADAARESRTRPTVLRTQVVARNDKGTPRMTRKAPCPYPGGTASGWVVDYPPEESPRDGPMAGGSSTSGRAACRTRTGWACPEEDGTVTGFIAENIGGVLTIDLVTSDVSTGTAKLEIAAGSIEFNGTSLIGGGGGTPVFQNGGDGSDGPITVVDGASAAPWFTGTGPYDLQRTILGGA